MGTRGRLLGTFWASPGRSCACLGRLLGLLGTSRVTFTPLRSFLEGFGKGLGRVWDLKIAVFTLSCAPFVFPVASYFAIGSPALPRYAPRSVTIGSAEQILPLLANQTEPNRAPNRGHLLISAVDDRSRHLKQAKPNQAPNRDKCSSLLSIHSPALTSIIILFKRKDISNQPVRASAIYILEF